MIERLRDWYDRVTGAQDRHPLVGPLQAVVRWSIVFYKKLQRDRAFVRAAGMAYATLVALVPFLLLVFGILSATGLLDANLNTIERLLFGTFLGDIPEVREFLMPGLVNVDLNALGVVGVVGLMFVASRLLLMIEAAYCEIYGVPVERPFLSRILNIYFAVTALPLLALAVIITTQNAMSHVDGGILPLSVVAPVVLYTVFLAALKMFPSTRVRWRPAMVGALFTTLLVLLLGRIFPWYVSMFGSDDPLRVIYGSVGIIPVFLLWLYALWIFVLLGVEVAYVIQNYGSLLQAEKEGWDSERAVVRALDVTVAVEAAVRVAAAFESGAAPIEPSLLARETGVSERQMWVILGVLEREGVVVRVDEAFTMARSPRSVTVAQVVGGWRRHTTVRQSTSSDVGDAIHDDLLAPTSGSLADAAGRWLAVDAPAPPIPLRVDAAE